MKKLFISLMVAALLTISTVAVASANHGENHKAVPQSGDGCDRAGVATQDVFDPEPLFSPPCPDFLKPVE